jgi:hypothetical protein
MIRSISAMSSLPAALAGDRAAGISSMGYGHYLQNDRFVLSVSGRHS